MTHDKDEQAKVWNLAEKIGFCMLATQVGDSIRSRPMSAHPQASENAFYFLTDVASHKDDEIETNRSVCLAFAESKGQKYVSISGAVEVLNDRSKIRDLWATPAKAWWDSPDDPSIRVLKVTPDFANTGTVRARSLATLKWLRPQSAMSGRTWATTPRSLCERSREGSGL